MTIQYGVTQEQLTSVSIETMRALVIVMYLEVVLPMKTQGITPQAQLVTGILYNSQHRELHLMEAPL